MFVLFVCRAPLWAGEGEFPSFRGMFRPSKPFGDTWGWWGECLGNSHLVLEFEHPPFPPYCAFPLDHCQMVFPETSPTCVLGGECFGIYQPVRAASLAPHGHSYNVPEVIIFRPLRYQVFSYLQLLQNDCKTIRFPTLPLIAVSCIRKSGIPTILCL